MRSQKSNILIKLVICLMLLTLSVIGFLVLKNLKIEKQFNDKNTTLVYNN